MSYRAIFFDLDHTLWDYETNSGQALVELYEHHKLAERSTGGVSAFLNAFNEVNKRLWILYDQGLIHRDVIRLERFKEVLEKINVPDYQLSLQLSDEYLQISPRKPALMPHAKEVLNYLYEKYPLIIITNGFVDIQATKLSSSGIKHYFKSVVTSEEAKHKKPSKEIFEYALREHELSASEVVMVGDNLITDIQGAKNASIDTVFYNPHQEKHDHEVNYEIKSLKELLELL
jgi:HAD superfamily (subfamily IA) hydrolase, TIGR02254